MKWFKRFITSFLFFICTFMISASIVSFMWHGISSIFRDNETKVCFTPGDQCDVKIANEINTATKTLDVQAYYLTNKKIIYAIEEADMRGVKVRIIVDKADKKAPDLFYYPIWVDNKVAIAHNKVMIIDNKEVITGSFNFTEAAQKRNAENVLFVKNKDVVNRYEENFVKRLNQSEVK